MPSSQHATEILQAVTRLQNRFIREPNPRQRFSEALDVLLQLTGSEYGFIGEVHCDAEGKPFLRTHAITNIAWNDETRLLYDQDAESGLDFRKLDNLFGEVIKTKTVVIANDPPSDTRSGGLPSGHPSLRNFMGVPFIVEGELIGMAGVANRPDGYEPELIECLDPFIVSCASMIWAARNERLRQEAEQALRASEKHTQMVSDLVTFVTFSGPIDPNGVLTFHRYRGSKIQMPLHVPLPLRELMSLRMSPADVAAAMKSLDDLRVTHETTFDYQAPGDDDLTHWFSCHVRAIPYPQGGDGWIMIYGAIIDITAKKLAALELLRQKQELQTIFDAVQACVIYLDTEGRFLRQNEYSRSVSGFSDEEQLGKTAIEAAPHWDDPRRRHDETLAVVRTGVPRLGSLETFELHGETRWASVDKVPTRDPDGRITGVLLFIRDVTDQRKAEIELAERNRFIERVTALTPNYMYVFDMEQMQPVYMNREAYDLLGYVDASRLNEFAVLDHLNPDDFANFAAHAEKVLNAADGEICELNYRAKFPDGSWHWLLNRAMPFERNSDGKVKLAIGTSIDITSLKNSEAALRNMVLRNDALLKAIPDLIFLVSAEQEFVDFHCPEGAILAVPPQLFLGRKVAEVLPQEIVGPWEASRQTALSDGAVHSFEYPMTLAGQSRRFEARVVRCGTDQTLVIARDVTEREQAETALRESEARFRQFAEGVDHVIWMANPAMDRPIFVNRVFETIFGVSRDELFRDPSRWLEMIHPDDRQFVEESIVKLTEGPLRTEIRIVRPDGELRWLRSWGLPIRSESGEIYMFAGIAEDITEQKASTERLNAQQTELAHVSRLSTLGQMVAAVAHEITQPLAAVANYAAVCEQIAKTEPQTPPALLELMGTISAQAQRAGEIIQQLRTYARRAQQHRALHDMNTVIHDSAALVTIDPSHRLAITFELQTPIPRVFIDRVQLQQVLINLFRNAYEAGEEVDAEPNRVLVLSRLEAGQVIVEVIDSGRGLASTDAAHLFQPFFTTKSQGLGMGLAICRTIVESHGGTIEARNIVDGGACFRVRLPAGE
jgi:PAS domain S-box-containing protein